MSLTLAGQASAPAAPGAGKFKFYIDDDGNAFIVDEEGTAVAVAPSVPTGIDGTDADDGQVWTADGADGARWELQTAAKHYIGHMRFNPVALYDDENTAGITPTFSRPSTGKFVLAYTGSWLHVAVFVSNVLIDTDESTRYTLAVNVNTIDSQLEIYTQTWDGTPINPPVATRPTIKILFFQNP